MRKAYLRWIRTRRYCVISPGASVHDLKEAGQVICYIRKQYIDNGIGRWALIRKEDGAFVGWCGIKLVNDRETNGRIGYDDLGYRLLPSYWNKGYAYEAAAACKQYAFEIMQLNELHATIMGAISPRNA